MDYFVGTTVLFPYSFTPTGWILCDGRSLRISQYELLFNLIGNYYGGDGVTGFNVPNMLGLEPGPGMNFYICNEGSYPPRS